jgi:predicted phosphoribosyltransferase
LGSYLGDQPDAIVLGIPNGGIEVAAAVARELGAPLGSVAVSAFTVSAESGLVLGAVTIDGAVVVDDDIVSRLDLGAPAVEDRTVRAAADLRRDAARLGLVEPEVAARTAVVVDDGVTVGLRMRAALGYVRRLEPAKVVCAVPVGPPATIDLLVDEADEVVCPLQPLRFREVAAWYESYSPVDDARVKALLEGTE